MPKQKDLKRVVRTRMQKTGESYTAARRHVVDKQQTAAEQELAPAPKPVVATIATTAAPLVTDLAALAGISDEAVEAKTGRGWAGWVAELDAVGAAERPHGEIARHLRELGIGDWWSQMVAVGYERIRGLREIGQRRDGGYEAGKSRTLPVPLADLHAAWSDPAIRSRWLPGVELTVRTAIAERSMRITWHDGSSVEATFYARGDAKSQVAVQHRKLAGRQQAERLKSYWGERLDALGDLLAAGDDASG